MPKTLWETKIEKAEKYHKEWENRFKCPILEDYWEGFQWRNIIDIPYYKPYAVNLIYAEIKKKLANILYQNLEYIMSPEPGHASYQPNLAMQSAAMKQDFTNTIIKRSNKDNEFNEDIALVAKDSYFRFGVMEVGYAADWRHPNKKPPLTTTHNDPTKPDTEGKLVEDLEVPENERIYYNRIKASRFRVSMSDSARLTNCSWCGYYTYIYKHVLTKTKGIELPKDFANYDAGYSSEYISGTARIPKSTNSASSDSKDTLELLRKGRACKVWKIWDNEDNKFRLLLEPGFEVIFEDDFYHLPFATHRHDLRFDGWYPVPPVYHWLNPQDEVNQAREQMRNYRRRFTRKFKAWGIAPDELEKFKSEQDGEIIQLKNPNSLLDAINNPEIGISIEYALNAGKDDFNLVSGSSSDLSTAQADRTSATQSKITAAKAQIIESTEQISFEKFYHKLARLTLLEAHMKFTSGLWVKNSLDVNEQFLSQIDPNRALSVRYITSQDLSDGYDIDIGISCINASPQRMQEELAKFVMFVDLVQSRPAIALSPVLIREAAFKCGYRNEKVIAEMQKAALLAMLGQAQMAAQQQGLDMGNMLQGQNSENMTRNALPASDGAIENQLNGQLGG